MRKKIISILLSALIVGGCAGSFSVTAAEKENGIGVIKPVYHNNLTVYYDGDGNEVDITELNNDVKVDENLLPSSYDLRDEKRVTPVRNQGGEGLCWDFASTASIESNILSQPELASKEGENPSAELDLSEGGNSWYYHTNFEDKTSKFYNDFNGDPLKGTGGGFPLFVATGLSSGYGVYPESLLPYSGWNTGYSEAFRFFSDYRLRNYKELSNDKNLIKKTIMDSGAVTLHYNCFHSNTYTVDGMEAYYDNGSSIDGTSNQSHVVAVVGWDDSFSRDNFNPLMKPENDGAWLCKNSWGEGGGSTAEGYEGYFWMSYETPPYGLTSFTMQSVDEYDNIYQHQITDESAFDEKAAANIFTAKSAERLEQISLSVIGAFDVSVEIYKLNEGFANPVDGELMSRFDASEDFTGIYNIDCPDGISFDAGDTFSVVINKKSDLLLKHKGDNENELHGASMSLKDGQWIDVADDNTFGCAAIKAFTSNINGADKSQLEALVKEAEAITPDPAVDADTIRRLNNQISQAKTVINDGSVSQNTVDNNCCLLKDKMDEIAYFSYTINTAEDYYELYNRVENNRDKNIKKIVVNADIDFGGNEINQIFTKAPFKGVFDGNGHSFKNFTMTGDFQNNASIFGILSGATIKNISFSDFSIDSKGSACLIASNADNSVIQNCSIDNAKIKAELMAASFCGYFSELTIEDCSIKNTKIYGNNSANTYFYGYSISPNINNCTEAQVELYSQNGISNNSGLSVSAYSEYFGNGFVPQIKLTDKECVIESFIGEITNLESEQTSFTKSGNSFSIDSKSGDILVKVVYDTEKPLVYTAKGDIETREVLLDGYYGVSQEMVIPSELYGLTVKGFTQDFSNSSEGYRNITSLTIPGTISIISSGLFDNMPLLESITLCEGVTAIDGPAFYNCSELVSVSLPDSLKTIGQSAFANCINLKEIKFGNELETIGSQAFSSCKALTSPVFPESLREISDGAFRGCSFRSVTLGRNIESIGEFAFGTTGMWEVDFKAIDIPDFTINGYASTAAESYAAQTGLRFVDIGREEPVEIKDAFDYSIFLKGDVNLDGRVNIQDATLISKYLAGITELTPIQRCNAIVTDASGKIDVKNVTDIQRFLAGIIDSLDDSAKG